MGTAPQPTDNVMRGRGPADTQRGRDRMGIPLNSGSVPDPAHDRAHTAPDEDAAQGYPQEYPRAPAKIYAERKKAMSEREILRTVTADGALTRAGDDVYQMAFDAWSRISSHLSEAENELVEIVEVLEANPETKELADAFWQEHEKLQQLGSKIFLLVTMNK